MIEEDTAPVLDVFDEIYRRIVEGVYRPGERLVEQRIAEELHSSRTPVREAIRRLQATGIVVANRNRGASVREINRDDVLDLYALRSRLEAFATELAAHRGTDDEIASIADAVTGFERATATQAFTPESLRAIHSANWLFHSRIVETARHTTLAQVLATTVDNSLVFNSFARFNAEDFENSRRFHRLIFNALESKQPGRAGRLMREHIEQGRDVLLRGLDDTSEGDYADLFRSRFRPADSRPRDDDSRQERDGD